MEATVMGVVALVSVGLPRKMGSLSLFPLYRHDDPPSDVGPAGDALHSGELTVTEAADAMVRSLLVCNLSSRSVFFLAGEVVFGGLQDRMITQSRIVCPGVAEVPVACVEAGRWSGGTDFDARTGLSPRRVREGAVFRRMPGGVDQVEVWNLVAETLAATHVHHSTGSLRAVLEQSGHQVDAMVALGPLPGQCGVAVGSGSKVLGVELFTTRAVLYSYWEAIVRSYAVDNVGAYQGRPSTGRVLRFLRRGVDKLQAVPVTADSESGAGFRAVTEAFVAEALVHDSTLIHVGVLSP